MMTTGPGEQEDRVQRAERMAREIMARRARPVPPPDDSTPEELGDTPPLAPDPTGLTDLPEGDPQGAPDVDYRGAFDRAHQRDTGALDRYDPEAGKLGLGTRIQNVVRASVRSPFGRFIVAIAGGLAGVSLAIVAATFLTWPLLVAAAILTPASLIYLWVRYQQWLGHKRYIFRLLETLGEDVSDFDINQRYRGGAKRGRGGDLSSGRFSRHYPASMDMTPERWAATASYLSEVFGRPDWQLATHRDRAKGAGLPDIAVSPDVGRLLHLLTSMTGGGRGASVAIEVGTLGGFSGIWIARGLAPGGRLYTIEPEKKHAEFARAEFETAGVADRVTLIEAAAPGAISELATRIDPGSLDLLFLDAIKTDYKAYVEAAEPMLRPGGLVIADNALGSGNWWIDAAPGESRDRDAVDAFNRWIVGTGRYDCACVPIREGVLIARRRP